MSGFVKQQLGVLLFTPVTSVLFSLEKDGNNKSISAQMPKGTGNVEGEETKDLLIL